jgi:hypothetical protein
MINLYIIFFSNINCFNPYKLKQSYNLFLSFIIIKFIYGISAIGSDVNAQSVFLKLPFPQ